MSLQKGYKLIVFSDTHLPVEGKNEEFENFLKALQTSSMQSERVVLLGDIFEVWSSVSYYNHLRGKKLLELTNQLKKQAEVILIEGNWDFFLCKNFKEHFTRCLKKHLVLKINGKRVALTHGHLFGDWQTILLHFILTNPISYLVWKTGVLKKLEVKIANRFLNKETNPLPQNYSLKTASKRLKERFKKSDIILCGHFHQEERIGNVFFLKDYKSSLQFYGITEDTIDTLILEKGSLKTIKSLELK